MQDFVFTINPVEEAGDFFALDKLPEFHIDVYEYTPSLAKKVLEKIIEFGFRTNDINFIKNMKLIYLFQKLD